MRETLIIDPSYDRPDLVRRDITTWLKHRTRNRWKITEDEDWDGRTVVTVNFSDSMDAADFRQWRISASHILRR